MSDSSWSVIIAISCMTFGDPDKQATDPFSDRMLLRGSDRSGRVIIIGRVDVSQIAQREAKLVLGNWSIHEPHSQDKKRVWRIVRATRRPSRLRKKLNPVAQGINCRIGPTHMRLMHGCLTSYEQK